LYFQLLQKLPRATRVVGENAINDNLIAVRYVAQFPETLIGLWEIRQASELCEQFGLQLLKLATFDRSSIVVLQWQKDVIFFHRLALPQS